MKRNRKKLIIICCISVLLIVVLALATSYALFRLNVTKDTNFKVRAGFLELSIDDSNLGNVVEDGKIIVNNLEPMKENTALTRDGYNFKLKNTGSIDSGYTIYLDSIVLESETKERLDNSLIKVNLTNNDTNESHTYNYGELGSGILDYGMLDVNEENSYTLRIWLDYSADNSAQDKYFAVQIRVDGTQQNYKLVLKDKILRDNRLVYSNPTLTTTSQEANENGLFKMDVTNGFGGTDGTTYFFRGNVTNNYVDFAGMTWRIVRINEDGTVRLILDDSTDTESHSYSSPNYYQVSSIKNTIESWYDSNFSDLDKSKVATGNYFCDAAKVGDYNFGNAEATPTNVYISDLMCNTDGNGYGVFSNKIGLLTYDEAIYAGMLSKTSLNDTNYLYKQDYGWWLMSWAGSTSSDTITWYITNVGRVSTIPSPAHVTYTIRIRPVINLKADVTVTGTGTELDPYVVE